jgi:hypothetical protein
MKILIAQVGYGFGYAASDQGRIFGNQYFHSYSLEISVFHLYRQISDIGERDCLACNGCEGLKIGAG